MCLLPLLSQQRRAANSPWEFLYLAAEKERESKLSATQIGIKEGGTKVCPRSRVHAACFEIKGQPFYGWFVDGSNDKTQARF
jgi:hypothetical protein